MENELTISTLQREISQKIQETDKLRVELKDKKREAKANFAYYKRQIDRKLENRDQEAALNKYNDSCHALDQEKLNQSKKMFTEQVVPYIATGIIERLNYQQKNLENQLNVVKSQLRKNKEQLAVIQQQQLAVTQPGFFSRFFGYKN